MLIIIVLVVIVGAYLLRFHIKWNDDFFSTFFAWITILVAIIIMIMAIGFLLHLGWNLVH